MNNHLADRPVGAAGGYLARFARFFFGLGVNGSGGLFSIRRSSSSLRRNASSRGSRSSSSRFVRPFGFVAVMAGV